MTFLLSCSSSSPVWGEHDSQVPALCANLFKRFTSSYDEMFAVSFKKSPSIASNNQNGESENMYRGFPGYIVHRDLIHVFPSHRCRSKGILGSCVGSSASGKISQLSYIHAIRPSQLSGSKRLCCPMHTYIQNEASFRQKALEARLIPFIIRRLRDLYGVVIIEGMDQRTDSSTETKGVNKKAKETGKKERRGERVTH